MRRTTVVLNVLRTVLLSSNLQRAPIVLASGFRFFNTQLSVGASKNHKVPLGNILSHGECSVSTNRGADSRSKSCSSALFSTQGGATSSQDVTVQEQQVGKIDGNTTPVEHFRLDYTPSPFLINKVFLSFDLAEIDSHVVSESEITYNPLAVSHGIPPQQADLVLDGEELELMYVKINGQGLPSGAFTVRGDKLIIPAATLVEYSAGAGSGGFKLETKVRLHPSKNLALSGLYSSGPEQLCTQCEAMGFRRITYHLDRPDVLSVYTVRLEADKIRYPILLSNGNEIGHGDGPEGSNKHWALWEDPFPKPSYLFAVVAGNLGFIQSTYITKSGREVKLGIYSNHENVGQLEHAMFSIKESMRWDEDTFGLECDLDVYNIVATNDFNMGAMENKGLNVFNSAYVLADPKTATDVDFENILGVIGHEYFHNWSGNRVTVRDWFQLTLKEGLTVFRDQWFTSDKTSHVVKRIKDVKGLRSRQFAEDAGPMAHPIRPESYISMDNFYTGTVYIKGAEVVGLYKTLLGEEGFKKGLKLYFERHDGSAVTCEEFRNAMADANGVDLSQMERWYAQAGTPVVRVQQAYDAAAQTLTLTMQQHTPTTPGAGQRQEDKLAQLVPVVVGLLDAQTGQELVPSTVLRLTEAEQTFVLEQVSAQPVLSALRGFSAPVQLEVVGQTDEDLIFLMAHDTDSFNRWDAGNRYFSKLILSMAGPAADSGDIEATAVPSSFVAALGKVLTDAMAGAVDPSLASLALQLPDEMTLMSQMQPVVDIDRLHRAHMHVKRTVAVQLQETLQDAYDFAAASASAQYRFTPQDVGVRRLRNTCLDYLSAVPDAQRSGASSVTRAGRAKAQFDAANCMTDKLGALSALASMQCAETDSALQTFHADAAGDALVLNKWFAIQASADYPGLLQRVKELKASHPDFTLSNPNRARSLINTFCSNLHHFHAADGEGYRFLTECILELDRMNPQVASRMVQFFAPWRRFDAARSSLMQQQLETIAAQEKLSRDTFEIVQRCLK